MTRVLLLGALLHLLAGCGAHVERPEPDVRGALARALLDVDAREPADLRDVVAEVAAAGLQAAPVGRDLRPVELLEVLAVDELRLRTDRGEEHVRLLGLHGPDPRLPAAVNAWFASTARAEFERWLRGGRLVEHALPVYGPGAAGVGPAPGLVGEDGLRLVTLARSTEDPELHADVVSEAIARGWAYTWHPAADYVSSDPRWVFHGVEHGFGALDVAREAAASWAAEAARVAALGQPELQRLGDELLGEFAAWLGWTPAATLRFEPVDPDAARQVLRRTIAEHIEHERAANQFFLDPLETRVEQVYARTNGYSPAGETIYLFLKPEISERQLRAVLIHEIAHQYQEELAPEQHFPTVTAPAGVTEAHAELLAMQFREARWPDFRGALAYPDDVDRLRALCQASGLTPDEVYGAYLDGRWSADLWTRWHLFRMGQQEFLFRQFRRAVSDGLEFVAGAAPGEVRITNTTDADVRAQFHGEWLWVDDEDAIRRSAGPPFNLALPAGARVRLRVVAAEQPFGDPLTGLFDHTVRP